MVGFGVNVTPMERAGIEYPYSTLLVLGALTSKDRNPFSNRARTMPKPRPWYFVVPESRHRHFPALSLAAENVGMAVDHSEGVGGAGEECFAGDVRSVGTVSPPQSPTRLTPPPAPPKPGLPAS